jgi:RNA polymerase sigma-70 factor (ECF subfamily)
MVFRIAYSYAKCTYDAEDITQDVFLKLYKCNIDFAADENIKAWLIRVAINQAKSLLRSSWKIRRCDLDDNSEIMAAALPDNGYELYEYVNNLKPKYRTIIYLYYYEKYSVNEIADILKVRQSTVTTQLGRARKQLKEMLLAEGYV